VAQTAACNRLHSVEARLARWLLAIDDHLHGSAFTVSHDLVSQMLGVHRPTVSLALARLRHAGVLATRSRATTVVDRASLERLSCECRRVLRREFERLLPHGAAIATIAPASDAESAAEVEIMREIAGRLLLANIREQEARQRAEEASRANDEFLAMVSHALRAPLHAILRSCAAVSTSRDGAVVRALQAIRRNAQAQLKLVDDLLEAARPTSAKLAVHARAPKARFDLPRAVAKTSKANLRRDEHGLRRR
jgi:signal transduction histidine kinase